MNRSSCAARPAASPARTPCARLTTPRTAAASRLMGVTLRARPVRRYGATAPRRGSRHGCRQRHRLNAAPRGYAASDPAADPRSSSAIVRCDDHAVQAVAALRAPCSSMKACCMGMCGCPLPCISPSSVATARPSAVAPTGTTRLRGRLAVDAACAGAAFAEAAAVFRAVQGEVVAQELEQRRRRLGRHRMLGAVDVKGDRTARPHRSPAMPPRRARRSGPAIVIPLPLDRLYAHKVT